MAPSRCAPADAGMDSKHLLAFVEALDAHNGDYHSVMIARGSRVVAEGWWAPYAAERVHLVYSVSKSFTASVVGQLVDEGRLDLDAPVWSYLTDDFEALPARWRRVLVRHCLSMTVGHTADAWGPEMWAAAAVPGGPGEPDPFLAVLAAKVPDAEPGSVFAYNQVATYLLAQAVAAASGRRLSDEIRTRLLEPYGGAPLAVQRTPQGRDLGYSGQYHRTESLLNLALTYLGRGVHPDAGRLLSPGWVGEAVRPTPVSAGASGDGDWGYGYGFSFWSSSHGYRGDGAFGQFALVLPEQDVAVAMTSAHDMQHTLDLVWEHLLPACSGAGNASSDARLAERLGTLAIPPLDRPGTPTAQRTRVQPDGQVAGLLGPLDLEPGTVNRLSWPGLDGAVEAGPDRWREGRLGYPRGSVPAVASGGWDADGLRVVVRLIETPHTLELTVAPGGATYAVTWREVPLTGPDPRLLIAQP